MNLPVKRESLPAVTVAAVIAIAFSLVAALGSLLIGVTLLVLPQFQTAPGIAPVPPAVRGMLAVFMLFTLALAVFGIFVGVGVMRRRNWARITMLVWGGIMALFGFAAVAFSLVLFTSGTGIDVPNANAGGVDPAQVMRLTRILVVFFYGIPAAIGIWWIALFTRKRVADAFTNPLPLPSTVDASGFPQAAAPVAVLQPTKPSCPIPVTIVAGLLIFGAVCVLLFAFVPLPSGMPYFFFGHAFEGPAGKLILMIFGVVSGVTGIGMLALKPWALYTQVAFQCLGLLNCLTTLFSPNYRPAMRAAMEKMYEQNPTLAPGPFSSDSYFQSVMIFSTLMIAAMLAVLLWQRSRFLEQSALAAKS